MKEILETVSEKFYAEALNIESGLTGTEFTQSAIDLRSDDAVNAVMAATESLVKAHFLENCMDSQLLETRLQSWTGAAVELKIDKLASRYKIYSGTPESDPAYVFDSGYIADSDGVISIAGFGDGASFNSLTSMSFSYSDPDKTAFAVDFPSFYLWYGENIRNAGVFNPVSALSFISTAASEPLTVTCALTSVLGAGFSASWNEAYLPLLDKVISDNGFGASFGNASLTLSVPVSASSNISVSASFQD